MGGNSYEMTCGSCICRAEPTARLIPVICAAIPAPGKTALILLSAVLDLHFRREFAICSLKAFFCSESIYARYAGDENDAPLLSDSLFSCTEGSPKARVVGSIVTLLIDFKVGFIVGPSTVFVDYCISARFALSPVREKKLVIFLTKPGLIRSLLRWMSTAWERRPGPIFYYPILT